MCGTYEIAQTRLFRDNLKPLGNKTQSGCTGLISNHRIPVTFFSMSGPWTWKTWTISIWGKGLSAKKHLSSKLSSKIINLTVISVGLRVEFQPKSTRGPHCFRMPLNFNKFFCVNLWCGGEHNSWELPGRVLARAPLLLSPHKLSKHKLWLCLSFLFTLLLNVWFLGVCS